MTKVVCWFSCGAASAVATQLFLQVSGAEDIKIARCVVHNEHPDNERFAADCEKWFGQPIISLRSSEYADCWDVWTKRRYLVGVNGAPCTHEMKKAVRWTFEREFAPDFQVFGFTQEEDKRAKRFRLNNPDVNLICPLIDAGYTKNKCFHILQQQGIEIPVMYRLGYQNNNCIGCVKGGTGYWNKIRVDFPDVFARMALLEREIGATICKLGVKGRPRVYLDELPPNVGKRQKPLNMECGLLCVGE